LDSDAKFVAIWRGDVGRVGCAPPEEEGPTPEPEPLAARACNMDEANCEFRPPAVGPISRGVEGVDGLGMTVGVCAVGRRNIPSIVGRRAAPKGVERKSAGRSLIHGGMDPPVRNPMQSFVKELQLKSRR